eukprot:5633703-Prymnesium_polylepis.1
MLSFSAVCLAVSCGATRIKRGRVHEWLGQLGADQEAAAASVVAGVVRVHPCCIIRQCAAILSACRAVRRSGGWHPCTRSAQQGAAFLPRVAILFPLL